MLKTTLTKDHLLQRYTQLCERTFFDLDFVLLTILASIICTFGFKMNSASVIVGAMVISPLLFASVGMGVAPLQKDRKMFLQSTRTLILGTIIAMIVAMGLSFFLEIPYYSEIMSRIMTSRIDYFFVAFFSGIAGTFAFFWPHIIEAVAGIAISVALMPPVVLFGIALAHADPRLIQLTGVIVVVNIIGIILGSVSMFFGLQQLTRTRNR